MALFGYYGKLFELRDDAVMEEFVEYLFTELTHHPYNYPVYQQLDSPVMREALMASDRQPGTIFRLLMEGYARKFGKKRWGDKDTRYPFDIPSLYRAFPKAKFIHIVRDPRAVAYSLSKAEGAPKNPYRQADVWAHSMMRANKGLKTVPQDQYIEVHYESLVDNPEKALTAICAFLGEDFEPGMLEFYKHTAENIPMNEYPTWSHNWDKPVTTDPLEKWLKNLTPAHIRITEAVAGEWMQHYGYNFIPNPCKLTLGQTLYASFYKAIAPLRQIARKHHWNVRMTEEVMRMKI
jgi:hypothetical protein